ncbi:3-methyladenine DNA glycosylase [Corynebacterium pygosceleis]|uniref:3-methyladenine DNA glycosylase n=1 Tax=Corynebacterium pygosceleis TaxID=2800406 RepID=UPI003AF0AD5B
MRVLSEQQWRPLAAAHAERARSFTADHLDRRSRGEKHPVWDFLFDYYPVKPAQLARWHPGAGTRLHGDCPHSDWRYYDTDSAGTTGVNLRELWGKRGESFRYIRDLLTSTADNTARFDCLGLHEWAMVYRTDDPRHDLPLRLGRTGTDAVVEQHQIRCTHYDAFRFFTPSARPLNITPLTREQQPSREQRGCVHATMDLYKWASKLGPLVPGGLFLDCFELACAARVLDMEASPYDVRHLGFGVVPIETAEGKRTYVTRQRELARRAAPLRRALTALVDETSRVAL